MLEFQEKKKLRKILYSKTMLVAVFAILFFIAKATLGVYYKQKASGANLAKAREEIAELKKREKTLNSEIDHLNTDSGVEEEIRKKFMVGKEGEQVIVIVDDAKASNTEKIDGGNKSGIWSRIVNLFRVLPHTSVIPVKTGIQTISD